MPSVIYSRPSGPALSTYEAGAIQRILGYKFLDINLLQDALTYKGRTRSTGSPGEGVLMIILDMEAMKGYDHRKWKELVSEDYQKHPTENRAINQVYKELATVGFAKGLARFVYICPTKAQVFGHVVTEDIMGVVVEAIIGAVKTDSNRVETTRNVVDKLGLLEPWMHPNPAPVAKDGHNEEEEEEREQ